MSRAIEVRFCPKDADIRITDFPLVDPDALFLVGVLAPAWYFAGRLVENNTAVRAIGELQQQPSRMQAALNSIQDRLRARGFVRDSIEQLKRATTQFDTPGALAAIFAIILMALAVNGLVKFAERYFMPWRSLDETREMAV